MATVANAVTLPLEVYLATSYHPDCDWIDGELKERNVGEGPHAAMQRFFLKFFFAVEERYGILAYPELRTQVSATHFRVPDVLVLRRSDPFQSIVTIAPILCIEILSPDDTLTDLQERIDDYLEMGVPIVWVVDPRKRKAWMADRTGLHATDLLSLPGTAIEVPDGHRSQKSEMFPELDAFEEIP